MGAPSEARYGGPSGLHLSPGSDGSDEPASCFDTPYSSRQPPLHYSLDRSEAAHPLRSQPHSHLGGLQFDSPGDSWPFSHTAAAHSSGHERKDSEGLEASPTEERRPRRLQGSGGALDSMAQALMSPVALTSEDGSTPNGLIHAQGRWGADERPASTTRAVGDASGQSGSPEDPGDACLSRHGGQGHAQQRFQGREGAGSPASSADGDGHNYGEEVGGRWEEGSSGHAAEGKVDEGRRLLALLGGDAAGPIELDTAMLYSPASTDISSHRTGNEAPPSGSKAAPSRATPGSTHQVRLTAATAPQDE